MATYIIGITGASGAIYGIRLIAYLSGKGMNQSGSYQGHKIYFSISKEGLSIIADEVGVDWSGKEPEVNMKIMEYYKTPENAIQYFAEDNFYSPIASGSVKADAMIIVPCSMKALAGVANGFSSNLIERAADVALKERRKLIVVPRETPLNSIHLENMLKLSKCGAHIIPPNAAFYNHPKTIDDMVDFIIGRILDCLNIENSLYKRWEQ